MVKLTITSAGCEAADYTALAGKGSMSRITPGSSMLLDVLIHDSQVVALRWAVAALVVVILLGPVIAGIENRIID